MDAQTKLNVLSTFNWCVLWINQLTLTKIIWNLINITQPTEELQSSGNTDSGKFNIC